MADSRAGIVDTQDELGAPCSAKSNEVLEKPKDRGLSKRHRSRLEKASNGQGWEIGTINEVTLYWIITQYSPVYKTQCIKKIPMSLYWYP